jgi:hypothetical protein
MLEKHLQLRIWTKSFAHLRQQAWSFFVVACISTSSADPAFTYNQFQKI